MDFSLFPGWLVMLVGLWTAGLICWLSDRCAASLRPYAGLCCLAYTALLWFVLTGGRNDSLGPRENLVEIFWLRILGGFALASALGVCGPRLPVPRIVLLSGFGLSTSGVCVYLGKPLLAGLSLVVAMATVSREWFAGHPESPVIDPSTEPVPSRSHVWLMGIAIGGIALSLLGASRASWTHDVSRPALTAKTESWEAWLQRHAEFPWLMAGLLVTSLAVWDSHRQTSGSSSKLTPET